MRPYKAVYAFVVAFLTGLITAVQSPGITTEEWLVTVLAAIVAGGGTYGISNR